MAPGRVGLVLGCACGGASDSEWKTAARVGCESGAGPPGQWPEATADRASGAGAGPRARVGGGGELVPRGHVAAAGWMAAAGGRCPVGSGHVRRWRG